VEAALDDTNLQRLLLIFDELRESSQLIVITHQRRTMESADALYGISMRGDGVSAVMSQRLNEREPAWACRGGGGISPATSTRPRHPQHAPRHPIYHPLSAAL
jgi:hypothetical protein